MISDFFNKRDKTLEQLRDRYNKNTRLTIAIAAIGVILFLTVAFAFPVKDKILVRFFPKIKSNAALCQGGSKLPGTAYGFIYTGGDLGQAASLLNTDLYYDYDTNPASQKTIFMIGKYVQSRDDPLGLQLLMDNNLSNADFKGLQNQQPPDWALSTSGKSGDAGIETTLVNNIDSNSSIRVVNHKSPSGTQIQQVFKKEVAGGQYVVFGSWVKTDKAGKIKIFVQNSAAPFQEFGTVEEDLLPDQWIYLLGYGKVLDGIKNFQLVLRVEGQESTAWFDKAVATVITNTFEPNQAITNLISGRCGGAWLIDNVPGWDQTYSSPLTRPLPPDIYALIYHRYYDLIKGTDPMATVLPGSLSGAPVLFDSNNGYSPKTFMDSFRASYKKLFAGEPPVDTIGLEYLATNQTSWSNAQDLSSYLQQLRAYMNQIPAWKDKPIWLTKLGVVKTAPNGGVDFLKDAMTFLKGNNLNVTKWFWYDTCGFNVQLSSLFVSNNKICSWPMKLSVLGQAYVAANVVPTPSPTVSPTPTIQRIVIATPSATLIPSLTATPSGSSSGKLKK